MSYETIQAVPKVTVILNGTEDWTNWYRSIKETAKQHDLWDYLNPDSTNRRPYKTEPQYPEVSAFFHKDCDPDEATKAGTTPDKPRKDGKVRFSTKASTLADLSIADEKAYNEMLNHFKYNSLRYEQWRTSITTLNQRIMNTTDHTLLWSICGEDDNRPTGLQHLKKRFAPQD
ncbi:hypothetical protein K491DRAFT_723337 [Lophiostoma macrostomum CBS 122681]|uniref:Uncharacterized protein n=1 Tax=Lophiostoma macrostomum CBS 122681 TaxID=1314788 RepID=A0A6A6SMH0_9PLEO|nr:hypothetical protein K491DRAFT_723337 [Lophiostoma macrostomum CBS 122681]